MKPGRVPPMLKMPLSQPPTVDRVGAAKAEHYRRLGLINTELERQIAALRARAQELRRSEHARYRTALEEARAA